MSEKNRGNENIGNGIFEGIGKYDIPIIAPCVESNAQQFISFNYAKTDKSTKHKGVHFFLDDYQFVRLWDQPNKYIQLLSKFDSVCSPDFSLYADYPLALQIYNHYRKMYLTAYYQMNGINMIPTVCWSDELSFDFCFDGMPQNSIVALSNTGCIKGDYQKELFKNGYYEMIDRLNPTKILFFGKLPDYLENDDLIQVIGNSHDRFTHLDMDKNDATEATQEGEV